MLATPPLLVWLLCGLTFGHSVMAAETFPTYAGLDEPQHVDMVVSLLEGDGWPGPGQRYVSAGVAVPSNYFYDHVRLRPYSKLPIPPRGQRGNFDSYGADTPTTGGLPNQIVQHPPLYYALAALLIHLSPVPWQHLPFTQFVFALRLISAFILAWVPMLAWGLGRALRAPPPVPETAAVLTLAVPGLDRIGGMVNNDSLMILMGAAVLVAAVRIAMGDLTKRTAAWAGVLLGVALLVKGFSLALVFVVGAAYLVGFLRRRHSAWLSLLLSWTVAFLVGGWWWLRNIVLYGTVQPNGWGKAATTRLYGPGVAHAPPFGRYLAGVKVLFTPSFWEPAGVGQWATISVNAAVHLSIVVGALVLVALLLGLPRDGRRLPLLIALLPAAGYLLIDFAGTYQAYRHYGLLPGLQGRYLYPAIPGFAVLAAVAVDRVVTVGGRLPARWLARTPVVVLPVCFLAVMALQVQAAVTLLSSFWAAPGQGHLATDIPNLLSVAPWPPELSIIPFYGTLAIAVACAAAIAGTALRRREAPAVEVRALPTTA